ncbi:MAG: hypothetical protein K9H64_16210 [Bacteroidales bacterium]|nr:hypothetical protein [Bacteroidales bacterium]MCF8457513.1 hypothetical protein [Bacteroidales bacterium]
MKTIKIAFFSLALVAILISSCKKDKDSDTRDQATGTYDYVMKTTFMSAGVSNELPVPFTGTFVIKKSDSDAQAIEFWESDKMSFQGTNIKEADQGLTFTIPSQTVSLSGITVPLPMTGYDYFEVNGTKYNGFYERSGNMIHTAFGISFLGNEVVFQITGIKK